MKTLVEYDQWHPEMFISATCPEPSEGRFQQREDSGFSLVKTRISPLFPIGAGFEAPNGMFYPI